jgi:hypothetical protein
LNLRDTEPSEFNHLDSNEIENSEIVQGDEGNLLPVADFDVEDTDLVVVPEPEAAAEMVDQAVVEAQPLTVISEDVPEPLPGTPDVQQSVVTEIETLKLAQPNAWQRVRSFLIGGSADDVGRLNNLTQAIEDAPESAVNYVLRAELYMNMREYALAQLDFQRAYELAETQFELADWGLVDQVMRDRALTGLEKVQRRLE